MIAMARTALLGRIFQAQCLRCYATQSAPKVNKFRNYPNDQPLLIECKRSNFNLVKKMGENYKFGSLDLASSGWLHRKSKGDWFYLNATLNDQDKERELLDITEYLNETKMQLHDGLKQNLNSILQITQFTKIQCMSLPKIYEGHHALIAAETGCGKTIAYMLPILQNILDMKSRRNVERKFNTPLAIILTPGRELAAQIAQVAKDLSTNLNINVKCLLGGNTKKFLLNPEFEDVDIVVASMGVFSKLITTGIYRIDHVRHMVLDEADTLLDDSFTEKLLHMLQKFPFHLNLYKDDKYKGTQLILASATIPTNINELLQNLININTIHDIVSPNIHKLLPHVEQRFLRVNKSDRPAHLLAIVKKEMMLRKPTIIFSNKTPTCDYVSIFLNNNGIKCINLNGDMPMKVRLGCFQQFQNGIYDVISTTDVGSRGLDTTRAKNVINFDFPLYVSDYIHRCGRIGRVGFVGKCVVTNLVSSGREIDCVQRIEHAARTTGLLPDVNANIKNIINNKILQDMQQANIPLSELDSTATDENPYNPEGENAF